MGSNGKIAVHADVVMVKTGRLRRNQWNFNRMGALEMRSLVHGIREEGFLDPIVAQAGTHVIVDGEHRWKAAKKLKMPEVPVIYLDVTDAEARKLTTALAFRRGEANRDDLSALVHDIRELEEVALSKLELDLAIPEDELRAMLDETPAEAPVAGGPGEKKAAAGPAKVKVDPKVPEGDFGEGEDIGEGGAQRVPLTFFAPDVEERDRVREFFWDDQEGECSFARLVELVERQAGRRKRRRKAHKG